MERRRFLKSCALGLLGNALTHGAEADRRVYTVAGAIRPAQLGLTLMHEHVLVDFAGADNIVSGRYDPDEVVRVVLPHLERIAKLGCATLVDCTPAYLGRDPRLLARLSSKTGLNIVTTTGYYGAGSPAGRFVPAAAQGRSVEQLAAAWIGEFRQGIEGTRIRPGIIKIGVGASRLSELDRKLARAAALTHRETGLVIASHTSGGAAAMQQLDILEEERVPASAFIWVHAQSEADPAFHLRAGQRGAWLEFDSLRPNSVGKMLALAENMARQNLLARVLVSGDAGWYHVGEPGGGAFAPYDLAFTEFIPGLRERLGNDAVRRIFEENPRRALAQLS